MIKISKDDFIGNASWLNNDWYECSNCGFDSLDVGFNYCPSCGEVLEWDINK